MQQSTTNWFPDKRQYLETLTATVFENPWIPDSHRQPNAKQSMFLAYDGPEAMYGGAAGGGKTDSLLAGALQYAIVPGYAALILMRSYADLTLPKAGISRSKEWLTGTGATWKDEAKTWHFPSGGSLTFGYLEHEDTKLRYKSAEFQFIGFDELTQFTETQYTYLFSRLRRLAGSNVPLRMRSATNPGGPGHEWVKKRFIPAEFHEAPEEEQFGQVWEHEGRLFFPARLEDNAEYIDIATYEESLSNLDPVTRAQYRRGDWRAHAGGRFKAEWFRRYRIDADVLVMDDGEFIVLREMPRIVLVDPANRKTKASKYTAIGVFGDLGDQRFAVLDMVRRQLAVEEIVPELNRVCDHWDPEWCGIEANGFQIMLVNEARKKRLYPAIPTVLELEPAGKAKLTRATPAIIRAERGLMYLPESAPWLDDYKSELCMFTGNEKEDRYTDQVDVTAYGVIGFDRYGNQVAMPTVIEGGRRR